MVTPNAAGYVYQTSRYEEDDQDCRTAHPTQPVELPIPFPPLFSPCFCVGLAAALSCICISGYSRVFAAGDLSGVFLTAGSLVEDQP